MQSDRRHSRARVLRFLASAPLVAAVLAARHARAAAAAIILPPDNCVGGWIAKPDVDYRDRPKGRASCASCTRFHRASKTALHGVCDYVCGPVAARGWCYEYQSHVPG